MSIVDSILKSWITAALGKNLDLKFKFFLIFLEVKKYRKSLPNFTYFIWSQSNPVSTVCNTVIIQSELISETNEFGTSNNCACLHCIDLNLMEKIRFVRN